MIVVDISTSVTWHSAENEQQQQQQQQQCPPRVTPGWFTFRCLTDKTRAAGSIIIPMR
jgi:hypothetical protein